MLRRASTTLSVLGLLALAVFGGALGMLFVVIGVAVAVAGDVYRLLRSPGVPASVGHVSIVALCVVGYSRAARGPALFPFVIAASLFLSFVVLLMRRDRANVTRSVASTLLPVVAVGLPASYLAVLRSESHGFTLAWVFVVMSAGAELGARTVTGFVRRRAITPRGHRTWEHLGGAVTGALIAAVAAAVVASSPFTWARALILGLVVGVVVTAGDLAWAGVQDDRARAEPGVTRQRARVLPWVGGVMLSAPVFFYVFRALVS